MRSGMQVGTKIVRVGKVVYRSAGIDMECCGQVGNQSCQHNASHISGQHGVYFQWACRPLAAQCFWRVGHEQHQVLLAYISVGREVHLARCRLAECVLIHHEMHLHTRLRGNEVCIGQV